MASSIDSQLISGAGLLKEIAPKNQKDKAPANGESFLDALKQTDKKSESKNETAGAEKPLLKFSNHALERMNTRGIHFTPEQITKIEQSMQKATNKGAKETLVLTDDSALIVSLKNNTVVTVMDKTMLKENVFTNIDSTVFV